MPAKKKSKRQSKPNYKLRARNIAVRKIAEEDGISFKEASEYYKGSRAVVELVYKRAYGAVSKRFLQVSPGKWLEVEKGKPMREIYTFGDVRDVAYIQRVRRMESYWTTIRLYEETFGLSTEEARARYHEIGRGAIMDELGRYGHASDPTTRREAKHETGVGSKRTGRHKRTKHNRSVRPDNTRKKRSGTRKK